jgi:fructokinase
MRRDSGDGPQPPTALTVVGTGLLALDVIIPDSPTAAPRVHAGGTCGNVLTALAYLGWAAYPFARLGHDALAKRICRDLGDWGVKLDLLLREPDAETPVIAQHIRGVTHSFSWRCPTCGADLPRFRSLRLSDFEALLPRLPSADVFFFDRVSPAALRLAEHYGARGALIVFEPCGAGDQRQLRAALAASHVVKFSSQRIPDPDLLTETDGPLLLIQTQGEEGLRFLGRLPCANGERWSKLPAIRVAEVVDTAGSGDWCTAGLLHALPRGGPKGLLELDESRLMEAIRYGQALAAWNCGFVGARGGMYDVTCDEFQVSVRALLAGESVPSRGRNPSSTGKPAKGRFTCPSCPML